MTFQELDREAEEILPANPLYKGVNNIIANASDNADDEAGRMASVVDLLAYCDDVAVVRWFLDRGVAF